MKNLRLHYLQHVPFEGLGFIENWAQTNNLSISSTKLFLDEPLPSQADFDWLIIMGGPMNIYQDDLYHWLVSEKLFIKNSIDNDKVVIGICLGAQLIANVLGEKVFSNSEKEIGWFPVSFVKEHLDEKLKTVLPDDLSVMHWHGDTFNLPAGATLLAKSEACKTQGFIFNDKVVALQFHLEITQENLTGLIENCGDEITNGKFIQPAETILEADNFSTVNTVMRSILDHLTKKNSQKYNLSKKV